MREVVEVYIALHVSFYEGLLAEIRQRQILCGLFRGRVVSLDLVLMPREPVLPGRLRVLLLDEELARSQILRLR